jgi:hypothetical protein
MVRAAGDRLFGSSAAWGSLLDVNDGFVKLSLATVSAGIGLHLLVRTLVVSSPTALVVGGGAAAWMASLTLAMVWLASRGGLSTAALIGVVALVVCFVGYRRATARQLERRRLRQRFAQGAPLSLGEAMDLLDVLEADGALDEVSLRKLLALLHPSIGELIPVRESPLAHGEGCRWITYWEGKSGWALVALCRDPGSATPIHAHPHRLLGKAIEGQLEELRFREHEDASGEIELVSRGVLAHEELVETDGLATLHVVRAVGTRPAIDLQLRGPEVGKPGRVLRTAEPIDFSTLAVGTRLRATEEIDRRPGHGGEGAGAGRPIISPPPQ